MPTQAPTGSIRESLLFTAIFGAPFPGSPRAAPEYLDQALPDLRHLDLDEFHQKRRRGAGEEQFGPRGSDRTSRRSAFMRSWVRTGSRGTMFSRGMKPSALLPRSRNTPFLSTRFTTPLISCPRRPLAFLDHLPALGFARPSRR